jgi:DNA polymerase-3 subunit beta
MRAETKELRSAVAAVMPATAKRHGIPALAGIVLEAGGGRLVLRATDLELVVETSVAAATAGEQWSALVPAAMLRDALRAHKGEAFALELDGAGSIRLNGAGSIRLLPLEDFPTLEQPVEHVATVDAGALRELVGSVEPACSADAARPVLMGALIECTEGTLELTATDSYRLHHGRTVAGGPAITGKAIVPGRAMAVVAKAIGAKGKGRVRVYVSEIRKRPRSKGPAEVDFERAVRFELELEGSIVNIGSRVVEGEFPNWRQLVPDPGIGAALRYDAGAMLEALAAVAPYCGSGSVTPMRLELNGSVIMSGSSPDLGTYRAVLEGATWSGEDMAVAFQPQYFAGCVRALAGASNPEAEIRDGLKPALFRAPGDELERVALVMPVRMPAPFDVPAPAVAEAAPWCVYCRGPIDRTPTGGGPAEHETACPGAGDPEPVGTEDVPSVAGTEPAEDIPTEPDHGHERPHAEPAGYPVPHRHEAVPTEDPGDVRAELEAGQAPREEIRRRLAETDPPGSGGEAWSELATLGEVDGVRVRLVTGPDGTPWVDVRRFVKSKRYDGPTRKGLAVRVSAASILAELLLDAAAASD